MSLYARVWPNASGIGMPIFLMICNVDKDIKREGMALWLTMKVVFQNMETIRPNAIVIDKACTELNAITKAINKEIFLGKIKRLVELKQSGSCYCVGFMPKKHR